VGVGPRQRLAVFLFDSLVLRHFWARRGLSGSEEDQFMSFVHSRRLALAMSALVLLCGCGKKNEPIPAAEDLRNPDVYGSEIKSRAVALLNQAKGSPNRAGELALQVSELVEDYEKQPIGDHGAKYKGLRDGAAELKKLADNSSPEVGKKIDELLALANSLPGEQKALGDELGKGQTRIGDADDR
jgi:hypothetical protein